MLTKQEQEGEAKYLSATFKIDLEGFADRGRSAEVILLGRRCASCWGTLVQQSEEVLEISVDEHLERIASQCAFSPDFIRPEMPVMEAVFRIMLSNGNQETTLEWIHQMLQERWSQPATARTPSPDKLYRMLCNDKFYGITSVSDPAAEQK